VSPFTQRRFKEFLFVQVAFWLVSLIALQLIGLFTPETYFMAAFVWFVATTEVLVPQNPDADWWQWLRLFKVGGYAVLAYIIARRVSLVLA
jgi:hypothetical protein